MMTEHKDGAQTRLIEAQQQQEQKINQRSLKITIYSLKCFLIKLFPFLFAIHPSTSYCFEYLIVNLVPI
jgi:hypothetical protein